MELKDVILSTLSEIGEDLDIGKKDKLSNLKNNSFKKMPNSVSSNKTIETYSSFKDLDTFQEPSWQNSSKKDVSLQDSSWIEEECRFLESLRERLLVLFEGFQSPNNKSVESKIDLTLNFLEYLLVILDERITKLKKL